ncbi:MAG: hypothetical protein Q9193_006669 [Seirophora villosa]
MLRTFCLYSGLFFLFAVSLKAYHVRPESVRTFDKVISGADHRWISNSAIACRTLPLTYILNDTLRGCLAPQLHNPCPLTAVRQARSEAASLLPATVQKLCNFATSAQGTDAAFAEVTVLDHQLRKAIDAIGVLADANTRLKDDFTIFREDAAQELQQRQRDMDNSVKIAGQPWLLPMIGFLNARKEFQETLKQGQQTLDEANMDLTALEKDQERMNNILSIFLVWKVILLKIQKELQGQPHNHDFRLWRLVDWIKEVILQRRQPLIRDFLNKGSRYYLVEVDLLKQRWEKLMKSIEDGKQGVEVQSA